MKPKIDFERALHHLKQSRAHITSAVLNLGEPPRTLREAIELSFPRDFGDGAAIDFAHDLIRDFLAVEFSAAMLNHPDSKPALKRLFTLCTEDL